ncbi:hypothetical protein OSB04_024590 [Centaurea solstitialis]|uniref:Reverse transcriptase Ty1/copia-type domain-containing protein n=1 Tax=Centaurea solstitialis TaxID=347529 RepID=A0AA38T5W4_9ASTR|nr:hypothetical protein OSB04_024590 [Centaurea solstitialis]
MTSSPASSTLSSPTASQLVFALTNVYSQFSFKLSSDGSKYKLWRRIFLDMCKGAKVYGHITGKSKPASDNDEDWEAIDSRIKSWFYSTCDANLLQIISSDDCTAKDLWDKLDEFFLTNKMSRMLQLQEQFRNTKKGTSSITDFCHNLKNLADALVDWDSKIEEIELVMQILRQLPPSYHSIVDVITNTKPFPSFLEAKNMLLLHESREESVEPHTDTPLTSSAALYSSTPSAPNGKPKNKSNKGTQGHSQAYFGNSPGQVPPAQSGLLGAPPVQSFGAGAPQSFTTMFSAPQHPSPHTFFPPPVPSSPYLYGKHQSPHPVPVPSPYGQPMQQSTPVPPPPQPSFGGHASQFSQPQSFLQRCDSNHHYLYPVLPPTPRSALASANVAVSFDVWHRRLGHQGATIFQFIVSRKFITCSSRTSTLCHASSLPPKFWVEALLSSVHTFNLLPSTTIQYKTPFEVLFGFFPTYSHLRVFGCLCYPNTSPTSAHKLAPRSSACVYLGPSSDHRGYRCLDLRTQKVIISHHVNFDETHFPFPEFQPRPSSEDYDAFDVDDSLPSLSPTIDTSSPPPAAGPSASVSSSQPSPAEPFGTSSSPSASSAEPSQPPAPATTSGHLMTTRSRTGSLKPKQIFNLSVTSDISPIPRSTAHAMCDSHWRAAMDAEMAAIISNHTWDLVPKPSDANIVGNRWLFRHKFDSNGRLERYKARLVAQGFSQQPGLDFDDTFSPVVKPATIRTVLSISISRKWPIHQLDVKNAFLHGDLTETVYMRFLSSKTDTSLFTYHRESDTIYLLLYVDDIILTTSSPTLISMVISKLSSEFPMSDLGPLSFFLGIAASRSKSRLFLSQSSFAQEILARADMVSCNPCSTPTDTKTKLAVDGEPVSDPTLYRSLVGALQYLTFTRPDIAFAVQQVCLFMHDPRLPHLNALKRILRYLKGTLSHGLHIKASAVDRLVAYSDAYWAGCPNTRRSTSGFCVYLGDNLVSWSSKRQHVVSRSSAEAEYRGIANVGIEAAWLRNLLLELSCPLSRATVVFCDNVSAMYLASNPVQHQRTKHVEIDLHFVRERVAIGHVRVLHVPSAYQYADIFTKGLPSSLFLDFRDSLNIRVPPDQTTRMMNVMNKRDDMSMGSETKAPVLFKDEYELWVSRFKLYIQRKENRYEMLQFIMNGPKPLPKRTLTNGDEVTKQVNELNPEEKALYKIDMDAFNYLVQAIPNDIYRKLDSYDESAKSIWDQLQKIMMGSKVGNQMRITSLMDKYENFKMKEDENLEDTYDRFVELLNHMKKNDIVRSEMDCIVKFLNVTPR